MKKFILIMLIAVMTIIFMSATSCVDSSDQVLNEQTEQFMQEANAQIGMPAIKNFQERKLAKMIFELRDQENLICYAYIVDINANLVFIGKCIGFGLPYSVQYTNPEKYAYNGTTLPQADPNGLFMPTGLSATWLMMIDPKTETPRPVYIEPQIIVSPFPLR